MTRHFPSRNPAGFVMLEAVLALALFATVATAMAVALNQLSSASTDMRREALLLRSLESAMTEAAHRRPLVASFETSPVNDFGVSVETQIAPLNLKNPRGQQLDGVYEISVTASLDHGGDESMQRSLRQLAFVAENRGGSTP